MATRTMCDLAQDIDFILDHLDPSENARLTDACDRLRADIDPHLEDEPGPDPLLVIRRVEERREHVLEQAEIKVGEGRNFTADQYRAEARMLYRILTGEKEVKK